MENNFQLSVTQISEVYREGFVKIGNEKISFVKEIEGKITKNSSDNPYNSKYERFSDLYVKDENGIEYHANIMECGEDKDDMQIAASANFSR